VETTCYADAQLEEVKSLWKLVHFEFITEHNAYNFLEDELNQKSDFNLRKDSHHGSKTKAKDNKANFSAAENTNIEGSNVYVFVCGGGLTSVFGVFVTLIMVFCGWKYRFHQKLILYFVLIFSAITMLQIVLIVSVCKK